NKDDPQAAEKFKEINEAAAVLTDEKKRAEYDRFGHAGSDFSGSGAGFDPRDFGFGGFGFDFDDIFDSFFGGGFGSSSRPRRRERGSDLQAEVEVTLNEVATGTSKTMRVSKLERCDACDGTGSDDGDVSACPSCHGRGVVRRAQRTPFGMFSTSTVCPQCRGHGEIIKNPCRKCHGSGRVEKTKKITVDIPPGVESGTRLRIPGEGEAGERNAPPGDLYVYVRVKPHPVFTRQGNDILLEVSIPFTLAALGGEIEVPTLEGHAKLKIPPGTQPGTVFRMRGKGLPSMHGFGTGSEKIRVNIEVPSKLSRKQKQLLEEFDKESKSKPFFSRIKDVFD
ncbi:molecular chaperone DnaJ, partial [Candidatus Woesearchaeota archaeon]